MRRCEELQTRWMNANLMAKSLAIEYEYCKNVQNFMKLIVLKKLLGGRKDKMKKSGICYGEY